MRKMFGRKLKNMSPASLLIGDYGLLIKEGIPKIELTLYVIKIRNAFLLKEFKTVNFTGCICDCQTF